MNNNFYVYFHINPVKNEVFTLGKGSGNRKISTKSRSKFWLNILNKYGEPKIIIVKNNISEKYAFLLENIYIKLLGRRDLGLGTLVNMNDGGRGGIKPSYEMCKKISETKKGIKLSDEHKKIYQKVIKVKI